MTAVTARCPACGGAQNEARHVPCETIGPNHGDYGPCENPFHGEHSCWTCGDFACPRYHDELATYGCRDWEADDE